jgi:SAM-dependent methyltransferase
VGYDASMVSFDSYERNLLTRLHELRQGDRAYELHGDAVLETLPYEPVGSPETDNIRILDVGCGLGFLSAKLAGCSSSEVVGIDPSNAAIELARSEHASIPNLRFHAVTAQAFPGRMVELGQEPFDRAVLNMVLHSVDGEECGRILEGVKESLVPHGALCLIVPDEQWLLQKLIEHAQGEGMERAEGLAWVSDQRRQPFVDLAVGIEGETPYQHSLTLYNRTLKDYASILREAGYGFDIRVWRPDSDDEPQTITTAYWEFRDHLSGADLAAMDRHVLLTQVR